jgi:glucosamine-phosphate N-acetyltransferase
MIRLLKQEDYKDYLNLLSQLTQVGEVTENQFKKFVESQGENFEVLVYELDGKVVGCVSYLVEQKIQRSFSCVMHIEDVVTDVDCRGKGISKQLLNKAIEISKEKNCYKIILDCSLDNIPFYEKVGFSKKEFQMVYRIKN